MALYVGTAADDTLVGNGDDDEFRGGPGRDIIVGAGGDDVAKYNIGVDGGDRVNLGDGWDQFNARGAGEQVRLTFTSSEVGNGSARDSNSMANQDGLLAVRLQVENALGDLIGDVSRVDDEGITYVGVNGVTFDVRDLVSGAQRGDFFTAVSLGTSGGDAMSTFAVDRSQYFNAGLGDDTITGGNARDFLVGGGGNDSLDGGRGDDSFIGGGGDDTVAGGLGDDTFTYNVGTDGADSVVLGTGTQGGDRVVVNSLTPAQVRLTFTSAEVGNGNDNDAGTLANQDGGLAIRMQSEDGADGLTGPVTRLEDENVIFVAGAGVKFDVRDLVSGIARGANFDVVQLGSGDADGIVHGGETANYYINAGLGDDAVAGGESDDFLVGGGGNDTLVGNAGVDSFIGGGGDDQIFGGAGSDSAIFNVTTDGADSIDLGGDDSPDFMTINASTPGQVRLTFTSAEVGNANVNDAGTGANQDGGLAVRVQAEDGSDGLTGSIARVEDEGIIFVAGTGVKFDVRDLVSGTARGDAFDVVQLGRAGADVIDQTARNLSYYINAGAGNDAVDGSQVGDFLVGGADNDTLRGFDGGDSVLGGDGNDNITGLVANDRIDGGAGDDYLVGRFARDTVTGGAGADRFAFFEGDFTGVVDGKNADRIVDFTSADGDRIVLQAVDADTGTDGDQAFSFVGGAAFSNTAGELRYELDALGRGVLSGDTDGDGAANFQIILENGATLAATDFFL